jgi:hypothetical protein
VETAGLRRHRRKRLIDSTEHEACRAGRRHDLTGICACGGLRKISALVHVLRIVGSVRTRPAKRAFPAAGLERAQMRSCRNQPHCLILIRKTSFMLLSCCKLRQSRPTIPASAFAHAVIVAGFHSPAYFRFTRLILWRRRLPSCFLARCARARSPNCRHSFCVSPS